MKTCAGRISEGDPATPVAKVTGYSINKTHETEEVRYLDDNCNVRKNRVATATQLTVDGELDMTDAAQARLEDMLGGVISIFPAGEISGAESRVYLDCDTETFNITGSAGGTITFQATITANGGRDLTQTTVL